MNIRIPTVLLLLILQGSSPLIAGSFTVEGTLTHERPVLKRGVLTDNTETETFRFNMSVDGCVWRMRLTAEKPLVTYDYCEVSFDGENLYYVRSIKSWVEDQIKAGKQVGSNTATAVVLRRPIPAFSANHEIGPLWLTYGSKCFFATNRTTSVVTPLTRSVGKSGLVGLLDAYKQEVIVDATSNASHGLQRIIFLEKGLTNLFKGTFTNSSFEVVAFTNVGGVTLPRVSKVTTYYPYREPGQQAVGLISKEQYTIVAEHVTMGQSIKDFRPHLPDVTHVSDVRFWERVKDPIKAFTYYVTEKWYTDREVVQLPEYKSALQRARAESGAALAPQARIFIIMLFVVLLAGPVIYILKRRRNTS